MTNETQTDEQLNNVLVKVRTRYVDEQSEPDSERYVFVYHVTITNQGGQSARLMTRHWVITNGHQEIQEVRGDGVVGEQPLLEPGDSHEYTSGTVLETPVGSMEGSYQMIAEDGSYFDASIPRFTLSVPHSLH